MRVRTGVAAAAVVAVTLTGCSGDAEEKSKDAAPAVSCETAQGAGVQALTEDAGVLAPSNVVSVTGTAGNYRARLDAANRVIRAVSPADVASVGAAATPAKVDKAVAAALGDAVGEPAAVSVVVVGKDSDPAVRLYRAGFGEVADVRTVADPAAALEGIGKSVAIVSLGAVAEHVGSSGGAADLNAQVMEVASAAGELDLALGSTGAVALSSQVVVSTTLAAEQVADLSALVEACGDMELVYSAADAQAAKALEEAYGVSIREVADPAAEIAAGKAAVAVIPGA